MAPQSDGLCIRVRLQPAGRANAVLGLVPDVDDTLSLKVSVTKVPEGGKANQALIQLLSKEWRVAKSTLKVLQGHTRRTKVLHLAGDTKHLADLLKAWAATKGYSR